MFARIQNVAKKKVDRSQKGKKQYDKRTLQSLLRLLRLFDPNKDGTVDIESLKLSLIAIGKLSNQGTFDNHVQELQVSSESISPKDTIRLLLLEDVDFAHNDLINLYYAAIDVNREGTSMCDSYVRFGNAIRRKVQHWIFNTFGTCVILAAGVLVGIQTYPGMEDNQTILILDALIMAWFEIEIIMKICSDPLRPRMFFCGPNKNWNIFDFVIVLACMPFMPFGNAAAAMRLLRLLRVLKLLSKNPQLQMILGGLMVGMESASYIGLLMSLVFYVYAVAGVNFFKKNDPFHFGSMGTSLVTLFRMSTLEDWTDVMYINYYGCEAYPVGGGTMYNSTKKLCPSHLSKMCQPCDPLPSPITAYIYFHSFIVMVALILISMFVGAITIAMSGILEELNEKQKEAKAKQRENSNKKSKLEKIANPNSMKERKIVHRIQKNLLRALGDKYETTFMQSEARQLKGGWAVRSYFYLGMFCHKLVNRSWFVNSIALVIVFAGLLVGLQTDGVVDENSEAVQDIDMLIILIFLGECVLKIIAEIFEPWAYFYDNWNKFDFFIVVTSMPFLKFLFGNGTVILRLLRLMRVLKLLRVSPTLQLLVTALLNAMSSIGYIGIILVLFYYLFAIGGNILFRLNDPWHFANMHLSMMSLFRASTLEDWTDIMYTNMKGCDAYAGYPYYEAPGLCEHPYAYEYTAVVFFVSFITIGGFILLSLFIGIVAAEMEHCQDNMTLASKHANIVRKFGKENQLAPRTMMIYKRLYDLAEEVNPSGGVSLPEMKGMLSMIGHPVNDHDAFAKLFDQVDEDDEDQLSYPQFCVLLHVTNWHPTEDDIDGTEISSEIAFKPIDVPKLVNQISAAYYDSRGSAGSTGMASQGGQAQMDDSTAFMRIAFGNYRLTITSWFQNFMLTVVVFAGLLVGLQVGYGMEDNQTIALLDLLVLVLFAFEIIVKFAAYHPAGLVVGVQVLVVTSRIPEFKNKRGVIQVKEFGEDGTVKYAVRFPGEVATFHADELQGRRRNCMDCIPHIMGIWLFFTGPERYWNIFDFGIVVASIPGVMGSAASALRLLRLARVIKIIDRIPKLKVIVSGLVSGLNSVFYIMILMALVFYIYAVLGVSLFKENDPWHFNSMALATETLFRCATLEDWTDVWFTNYYGCNNYTNDIYVAANSSFIFEAHQANCTAQAQPVVASVYFISFTVISAFVMMALFVGSILISIMDAVDTINKEIQQAKRKQRRKRQKEAMVNKDALSERIRRQQIGDNILISWEHSENAQIRELAHRQRKYVAELSKLDGPFKDYYPNDGQTDAIYDPSVQKNPFVDFKEDLSLTEAKFYTGWRKYYFVLAYRCRLLSNNVLFQLFINLVIIFAAGMVGVQAAYPEYALETMLLLDEIVSAIFLVEVIVHIVQEGFTPGRFFVGSPESGWNRLDFIIVVSSYSEFGSLALLFRMVRLARVLKALKALPQLRVMVTALVNSMDSINFVCILMFLVYYIFAIFGMMLFKTNDPWHFRNLHETIMTLFRVASGEDWTDVMYTAQYGCKEYPSPSLDENACSTPEKWGMSSVAYFVVFFTLGGLVFLNLFIGVITAGMADALGGYEDEKVVMDRLEDFTYYNKISDGTRVLADGSVDPMYYAENDVVGYLIKAFNLTDITDYSHLDRQDLELALHAVHLAPTKEEVDLLMEPTNGLFVGCRVTVIEHEKEHLNGVRGLIDRQVGPNKYELKVETGLSTTKRVLEARNLEPDNPVSDHATLDKASWIMVFVNHEVLLGMKSIAETAHSESFSAQRGDKIPDKGPGPDKQLDMQQKKVIV